MIDLEAIEKAAEAATPGPWAWRHFGTLTEPPVLIADHGRRDVIITDASTRSECNGLLKPMFPGQPNADYIATMNPAVALALVKELRALRKVAELAPTLLSMFAERWRNTVVHERGYDPGEAIIADMEKALKELRREP